MAESKTAEQNALELAQLCEDSKGENVCVIDVAKLEKAVAIYD